MHPSQSSPFNIASLMNKETKQWTWTDGWILMSVYLAQSSSEASLADVMAAADATNHAIPTSNELTHAFTKLVNSGVLIIQNSIYIIGTKYLADIENSYKSKGGLFESANKGKKWLKKTNLKVIKTPKTIITDKEARDAYNKYISIINKKG